MNVLIMLGKGVKKNRKDGERRGRSNP